MIPNASPSPPGSCPPPGSAVLVALVIPVFNEVPVLPELFGRLTTLFDSHPAHAWRAILVDDGSRDNSAGLIRERMGLDDRFECLQLARNFGFQGALAAGLDRAADLGAEAVITLDADLQDPPEIIPALIEAWRQGADVVRAVRRSRRESGLRRLGFDLFHAAFGRLSDFPVEPNTGTFGLLGRPALEAFRRLPERHRFFPGLRSWIGFATADVAYDRLARAAGQPTQSMRRLVRYALDGFFSFSYLPLRLLTWTGLFISGLGFALGLFFVVKRILGMETAVTGFTTLVTLMTFLGGVQLIGIGVLGEYLGRIYDEVKQRPVYLIKPPARGPAQAAAAGAGRAGVASDERP